MTKHTPGPYTATGLTAISGAGRIIANVTPAGEFATVAEVEATRALFVAAPDLLAALTAAVEAEGPFGTDRRPAWFNAACAAIGKAAGGLTPAEQRRLDNYAERECHAATMRALNADELADKAALEARDTPHV